MLLLYIEFSLQALCRKLVPAKIIIEGLEKDATTDRTICTLALESHTRLDLHNNSPKMRRHALSCTRFSSCINLTGEPCSRVGAAYRIKAFKS